MLTRARQPVEQKANRHPDEDASHRPTPGGEMQSCLLFMLECICARRTLVVLHPLTPQRRCLRWNDAGWIREKLLKSCHFSHAGLQYAVLTYISRIAAKAQGAWAAACTLPTQGQSNGTSPGPSWPLPSWVGHEEQPVTRGYSCVVPALFTHVNAGSCDYSAR